MRFWLLTALFLVLAAPLRAEEPRFFSELNDIPLMPGLYELTEDAMVFDKPEGRIVTSAAASETENINEIKAFYDSVLPQLGWVRQGVVDGAQAYVRQGETLTLRVARENAVNTLKLMVSPQ